MSPSILSKHGGADFWPLQLPQLLLRNKRTLLQPAIHPQAQGTERSKPADNGILKNLITRLRVKPAVTFGREILRSLTPTCLGQRDRNRKSHQCLYDSWNEHILSHISAYAIPGMSIF